MHSIACIVTFMVSLSFEMRRDRSSGKYTQELISRNLNLPPYNSDDVNFRPISSKTQKLCIYESMNLIKSAIRNVPDYQSYRQLVITPK